MNRCPKCKNSSVISITPLFGGRDRIECTNCHWYEDELGNIL